MVGTTGRAVLAAVVLLAGVYFAPKALDAVGSFISDVTGANDAVVVGEGDATFMITADRRPQVTGCSTEMIATERRCDDMPVLVVDAAKIPFIARNTKLAWESGLPAVLTMDRSRKRANRARACGRFVQNYSGQCDEYPMAATATADGGAGARTEEVPRRENACQGGLYVPQYPPDGDRFLVVISNPAAIATGPFTGTDIAVDQNCR